MYRVEFTPAAERDLGRLDASVRRRILKRLAWLEKNSEQIRHVPLGGPLSNLFKLRVGDWRILYDLAPSEQTIWIHQIGHRGEVYREK